MVEITSCLFQAFSWNAWVSTKFRSCQLHKWILEKSLLPDLFTIPFLSNCHSTAILRHEQRRKNSKSCCLARHHMAMEIFNIKVDTNFCYAPVLITKETPISFRSTRKFLTNCVWDSCVSNISRKTDANFVLKLAYIRCMEEFLQKSL